MNDHFDFIVIGGGSAGYAGASMAAQLGLRVAVVEGAREIGGLCILRGCMPSKTLLESAQRAEAIRQAGEFGLRVEYLGADAGAIRARKRQLIGEFADYRRGQLEAGKFEFIRGAARFIDAQTIEVGERRIAAHAFLIATGSTISVPPIYGLIETGCLTSDDVLDADEYPRSVCVLGGGAIALELASFFHGIGVPTTVVQRSAQVLREMDADLADTLVRAMEARGITAHCGTRIVGIGRRGSLKTVCFTDAEGAEQVVEAHEIIAALGRTPNSDGLGLEDVGVARDGKRIATTRRQQTTVPHIFAAGDVCSPHEIVHVAIQQGEFAARNAARLLGKLGGEMEETGDALKLFAVFTHPQIAAVGLSEREAAEQGIECRVAKYPFADHGKALVRGETHGFVKLLAERDTGRLVGAACVGAEASELIHEIVVAMHFGATARDLMRIPHYHPTLSEIWTYPAEELAGSEETAVG